MRDLLGRVTFSISRCSTPLQTEEATGFISPILRHRIYNNCSVSSGKPGELTNHYGPCQFCFFVVGCFVWANCHTDWSWKISCFAILCISNLVYELLHVVLHLTSSLSLTARLISGIFYPSWCVGEGDEYHPTLSSFIPAQQKGAWGLLDSTPKLH